MCRTHSEVRYQRKQETKGGLPSIEEVLYAQKRLECSYVPRRGFYETGKRLIVLLTVVTLIAVHGYFTTTILLMRNGARDGTYPSLDKAIESTIGNLEDYGQYYRNVSEGVSIVWG